MNRLLILACSQKKKSGAQNLPAVERYDGPTFRVLRKFLGELPQEAPHVLILSAQYGLIEASHNIPHYDHCMSAARARELRPQVLESAKQILKSRRG